MSFDVLGEGPAPLFGSVQSADYADNTQRSSMHAWILRDAVKGSAVASPWCVKGFPVR